MVGKVITDGAVELYHDNSKRISTTTTGASITRQNSVNILTNANYGASGDQAIETSGDLLFYTNASSIAARLDQDGLKFNADTAVANALDDFEEGSWTPTAQYNTGSHVAVANAVCRYVKIGSLVHVSGRFSLTSDANGGSGELRIGGLPLLLKITLLLMVTLLEYKSMLKVQHQT